MTTPADPPAPPSGDDKEPAWYREQIDAKTAENAELVKQINRQKVHLMASAFEKIGLDPTKGIGKAVAHGWEGDADPEAIKEYAIKDWDWEPPADKGQGSPIAGEITSAQQRVSAAVQGAESTPTEQIDLDIAAAEERGDFAAAVTLKVAKFRQTQGI